MRFFVVDLGAGGHQHALPASQRRFTSRSRFVEHSLDLVPIEVANERSVVARAVLRPQSGSAVVDRARSNCSGVELVDRLSARCSQRKMPAASRRPRSLTNHVEGERFIACPWRPISDAAVVSPQSDVAEGAENGIVEMGRASEVANAQRNVVKHGTRLAPPRRDYCRAIANSR